MMEKFEKLTDIIRDVGSLLVAYSGGTDSSFLLKVAHDTLGDNQKNLLAVTATSSTYPKSELLLAKSVADEIGASQRVIASEELDIDGFSENSRERCFFCKGELFSLLTTIAKEEGLSLVADGSNLDDLGDYRPGRKAAKEHGVRSLLVEAGMTKKDIRYHAKRIGLSNWDKPAAACLASRFPYGTTITKDNLGKVEMAEEMIKGLGFDVVRVRYIDGIARIEVEKSHIEELSLSRSFKIISEKIIQLGFDAVEVDSVGYRTGSMNESLYLEKNSKTG